ncbi:PHOMO B domain-containing protein [Aphelenchoides bicaudatus]|nr:PHOMO B domain-containing protein [Aphelenchoides bicaudatus]
MFERIALCLIAFFFVAQCKLDDQKLSSVLSELVDLRTELGNLFQSPRKSYENEEPTAEWVVHIDRGVSEAQWIANLTGAKFVGAVHGFPDLYVFHSHMPQNRSENHRIRRDLSERQRKEQIYWSELQTEKLRFKRELTTFNDPLWQNQWEINGQNHQFGDMRIADAWAQGYTGNGVVVSILDDGVDGKHKDLEQNYDPNASYDLNGNDYDPTPTMDEFNKHGTRCAGEIAMAANNSFCGVGVAYNSKIGGVRMLDGRVNDRIEAEALSLLIDHVDIFSSSWGPQDNGKTVEGPGKLASMALKKGIKEGRDGKGVIYVWASGNGGQIDDCSCDGYASSPYSFTVSGTSDSGQFPWYGEHCSATLATTFSSGTSKQKKIVTIDPQDKCTSDHTGTSASAPLAAGIIALTLQANPKLTWREIQHLAVYTSNPVPLFEASGWQKNGAGLWSSAKFGFGLMDAYEMTKMAKSFQPLDKQQKAIKNDSGLVVSFSLNACKGQKNEIGSLEHVRLIADIDSNERGTLSIWLESPSGMRSQLLHPRVKDSSTDGFKQWPFTSVQFWGENPFGLWKVHIDQIKHTSSDKELKSMLKNVTVELYGTSKVPAHTKTPKEYKNVTNLPESMETYLDNEENVDISNIESTVYEARQAERKQTPETEKHLIAVDRLVRQINKMNLRAKRSRQFAHVHHSYEK